jgi:hypothetical protein
MRMLAADIEPMPGAALTIYHPFRQMPYGGRLFVHAAGDAQALVAPVTRIIREISQRLGDVKFEF